MHRLYKVSASQSALRKLNYTLAENFGSQCMVVKNARLLASSYVEGHNDGRLGSKHLLNGMCTWCNRVKPRGEEGGTVGGGWGLLAVQSGFKFLPRAQSPFAFIPKYLFQPEPAVFAASHFNKFDQETAMPFKLLSD